MLKTCKAVTRFVCTVTVLLIAHVSPALAQDADAVMAAAAKTVRSFHEALAAGDSNGVSRLLAPDAVILESGGLESRKEYLSHHLAGDIEFAQAVSTRRGPIQATVSGEVAWVSSTSKTEGNFRQRVVDLTGAELMVLTKTASGWAIRANHWSSRSRH